MNGVRDLTVKSAASGDRVQRSFLSDRSLSKHSCKLVGLLSICNIRSVRLIFWRLVKHLLIIWPLEDNLYLPWVMRFLLVPHLPRLVAWEQRITVAN